MLNLYILSLYKLLNGHWSSPARTRNIINLINQRAMYLATLN